MGAQDNYFDRIPAKYQIINKELQKHDPEKKREHEIEKDEEPEEEILHNLDKKKARELSGKTHNQKSKEEEGK